ncbi:MAG TPA: hypothetical protein VN154_02505, partial [Rhizomicrobium sp.]|nr:hypothetical protein [Rhizomicrobium sp.]
RHELRLAWRDTISIMTAGRPAQARRAATGLFIFVLCLHGVAYLIVGRLGKAALAPDLQTLIAITAGMLLASTAMVSQTMENVTRSFYSRSDLELILSSPVRAERLFAIRIGAIALFVGASSLLFIGPFINVLVWEAGPHWLAAYGVLLSVALVATAIGVVLTALLFRLIGPKRTRLAAQVVAAIIGAVFVIGLQIMAMFSIGTMSRLAFLQSQFVMARAPDIDSAFWGPAQAALGDPLALAAVLGASLAFFLATTAFFAPQFGAYAVAAWSVSRTAARVGRTRKSFRVRRPVAALRHKEILLLLRDPWLISQSLMQLLYLLPPALLLWQSFSLGMRVVLVLVPVLIMAAGQLSGGLAWLTICGEDAPDLVQSAPLPQRLVWRAKIEAVMLFIVVVFAPFLAGLLLIAPRSAVIAGIGIAASAASSAAIQFWFRAQAKRSSFRRRYTSSRIATFAEAFSSITWAGAGAIAAAGSAFAGVIAMFALGILALVRLYSPSRERSSLVRHSLTG